MPLRQLQRPLLRTTIAAAAASTSWRPISVQLLHGSSCRRYSSSTTSSSTDASSQQQTTQPKKTLFEELFPDESKTGPSSLRRALNGSSKTHKDEDVEPEPLALPKEFQAYANDPDADVRAAYDNRALLVLSGAPKSLTESDFFRTQLGGPARHVEGWSSAGIHRIVPMRDPETLEPAGQYYIVFESGTAAVAWQEEVSTLWRLARARNWSRQLVTGDGGGSFESRQLQRLLADRGKTAKKKNKDQKHALGKTDKHHSLAGYESLTHDEGEDGNDLESASVRNFTLVPQSQRYDIERPVYTRLDSLLHNGAPSLVERLMDKAGTRHLVLLVLEGGRLSIPTLRALVHEDGAERNLAWRVKGLDRDYNDSQRGGGGIMAFGKSSLKASEQAGPEESLLRQINGAMGEEGEQKEEQHQQQQRGWLRRRSRGRLGNDKSSPTRTGDGTGSSCRSSTRPRRAASSDTGTGGSSS
ncbi:hypothetical protein PG997_008476 [Apiospora hydei]|uniref:Uncharacterized protein n=1 Tax=Apiospora hydei TaxID=1337664 RepID=A0ABR1WEY6_9PEZI